MLNRITAALAASLLVMFALTIGAAAPASGTGMLAMCTDPEFKGICINDFSVSAGDCRNVTEADVNPIGIDRVRSAANATDHGVVFFPHHGCLGEAIVTLLPNGSDNDLGTHGAKSYRAVELGS